MRLLFIFLFLLFGQTALVQGQKVIRLKIDGSINPATADYIKRGLEKAEIEKAEFLLIQLNTPGGLLKSTRGIVGDIFESPVPVVVFVAPNGAHAGSAGVFITMAAHVAAMAPGTNIGAAHPVAMNSSMDSIMNDKGSSAQKLFLARVSKFCLSL